MPKPNAEVNKSEVIRELLKQKPKANTKEIVEILAQKGITVHPNLVYLIKSKKKQKKRRQKRQRVLETTKKAGIRNPVDLVLKVKILAGEAGGMHNLKQLVDVLAQ